MGKPSGSESNSERGAVAVLVAASLLMMMGFAAVVVDVGAAFSERRQDQSASDVAALSAVQFARGSSNKQTAADNGADEAREVAAASLDVTISDAEWSACTDATRPAEFDVVSSDSPCISFTTNLQKARVVIPTVAVPTTFGRVLGVTEIETSAFAEAQADLARVGHVMPFGLPGGSAGDTEVCLRDGNNLPPPCDGPDSGNFGTLDFSLYGNETTGTQETCGNAMSQGKLVANMVAGIDHPIATTADGGTRTDAGYCPIFNARPNYVAGQTGIGSALYTGMIDGTSTRLDSFRPGRIAKGSNTIPVESGSPEVDDTGLWTYTAGSGTIPASCSGANDTAEMATCIEDWKAGSYDALFDIGIGSAVRFGAVPQIDANSWGSGTNTYGIADIVPVYVQGSFWGCTGGGGGGGGGTCDIVHYPGDSAASSGLGSTVNGANRLAGITAFLLELDMLPEPLRSNFPTTAEQVDYALTK